MSILLDSVLHPFLNVLLEIATQLHPSFTGIRCFWPLRMKSAESMRGVLGVLSPFLPLLAFLVLETRA
jgi:hypothetical protein